MLSRRIIRINKKLCNGCGLCAKACHEGAIGIINGKAELLREDFCDGLGDCLPTCPTGAISFEDRKALAYDAKAVEDSKLPKPACSCPGSDTLIMQPSTSDYSDGKGMLSQWPVQIKLVSVKAPFYDGKGLLIASDCSAFACGSFHEDYIKGRTVIIGCPKLDNTDYSEKLAEIIKNNDITDILTIRMEVPCCSSLVKMTEEAIAESGKNIPMKVITLSRNGTVIL
ncbi:MAG: 4Fe-4S binding protein [Candidatus Methanomethylophilaceae archaeon]|nr:4Fe-4S binding protein [Candidatus Methanomethylophilaceae archaeon]MDD3379338.1 4Fe-4S binding protein [Candidatus Methanomethylophilaceae archaeon]